MHDVPTILVVSDATGATAESVLTSVLVQFRGAHFTIKRHPFIRTEEQIDEILAQTPDGVCVVVHTLVSGTTRDYLSKRGTERGWKVIDVMGPLIQSLSGVLDSSFQGIPGALTRELDEEHLLTESISFTMSHDDGRGLDTLEKADLIILGVSRTGKTPTSIYLSCRKLRVANYPIVHGIPLPPKIFAVPVKKVGLRMNVDRLAELRSVRMKRLARAKLGDYSSRQHIQQEVEYSEEIFRQASNCWTLDVTNRSIEETADWIVRTVL